MMSFIETYTKSITISSVRFYNKRRDSEREEERPETKTLNERDLLYYCGRGMRRNEWTIMGTLLYTLKTPLHR